MCILGSIPELGDWKEFKYHLVRKGDVWESQQPLYTHNFFFRYKYAIMEENGTKQVDWEKGVDRLADLELMPDMQNGNSSAIMSGNAPLTGKDLVMMNKHSGSVGIKVVHYDDTWEQYKMCFTIWHPTEDLNGNWMLENNKTKDVEVSRISKEIDWMDIKYGKDIAPVQFITTMKQLAGGCEGQFKDAKDQMIIYKYKKTSFNGMPITERGLEREIHIENPHEYRGHLGALQDCFFKKSRKCFIINGWMYKADGNFVGDFFFK